MPPSTATAKVSSGCPPSAANQRSGESAWLNASRPHGKPPNGARSRTASSSTHAAPIHAGAHGQPLDERQHRAEPGHDRRLGAGQQQPRHGADVRAGPVQQRAEERGAVEQPEPRAGAAAAPVHRPGQPGDADEGQRPDVQPRERDGSGQPGQHRGERRPARPRQGGHAPARHRTSIARSAVQAAVVDRRRRRAASPGRPGSRRARVRATRSRRSRARRRRACRPGSPGGGQPPSVCAANAASNAIAAAGSDGRTAAQTAAHGPSAVTGASEPNASGDAGRGELGEPVQPAALARPAGLRTSASVPPQAASNIGCIDATSPDAASRAGSRTYSTCSSRDPTPARAAERGRSAASNASSTWSTAASPMTWKPACSPAVAHRTMCSVRSPVSKRSAPLVSGRSSYGSCSAAVCEPSEPSQNRSPAAPTAPSSRARLDPEQLAPVPDHLRQRFGVRESEQGGQVVRARDRRAGHLVHARDAQRRGVPQRRALQLACDAGGERGERGRTRRVVRVAASDGRPARIPDSCGQARHRGRERGRHHGRVRVHAGQVDRAAVRRAVEFARGRRPPLGPASSRPSRRRGPDGRGRLRAARSTAASASASVPAAERSSPDSASPVAVACTCASTNAGVTQAPARSTTRHARRWCPASSGSPIQATPWTVDDDRGRVTNARSPHPAIAVEGRHGAQSASEVPITFAVGYPATAYRRHGRTAGHERGSEHRGRRAPGRRLHRHRLARPARAARCRAIHPRTRARRRPPARLRRVTVRRPAGQRPHRDGRRGRPLREPLVLRRGHRHRRDGAAQERLRPAALQPRRRGRARAVLRRHADAQAGRRGARVQPGARRRGDRLPRLARLPDRAARLRPPRLPVHPHRRRRLGAHRGAATCSSSGTGASR